MTALVNKVQRSRRIQETVRRLPKDEIQRLSALTVPRVVEPYFRHIPHPAQQVFLTLTQEEVLYGGSAGSGKSDALLLAALQYVDVPGYRALILRRTWPDLALPGAIMHRAREWLGDTPAKIHEGGTWWSFPSGASLHFGHLLHDKDKLKYQGSDYSFVAFDELTQWPVEGTYDYLFSRIRKPQITCLNCNTAVKRKMRYSNKQMKMMPKYFHATEYGRMNCTRVFADPKVIKQYPPSKKDGLTVFDIPLRMRAATNPGGPGNDWVKARFIDPRTRRKDAIFVPALLTDNPSLNEDEYRKSLSHLNPLDRERLLNGDWDVVDHGDFFDRGDFVPVERAPVVDVDWRVRFWDMAATEDGGDYTCGVKMSRLKNGRVVIEDVARFRKAPADVEKTIYRTAQRDGLDVAIYMEQEPGSSGKAVISHYRRDVLAGYRFQGVRTTGNKASRALALSSYVKAEEVSMVIAPWNVDYLNEMEVFPHGAHDDQVDGSSGAFNELTLGKRGRLLV